MSLSFLFGRFKWNEKKSVVNTLKRENYHDLFDGVWVDNQKFTCYPISGHHNTLKILVTLLLLLPQIKKGRGIVAVISLE